MIDTAEQLTYAIKDAGALEVYACAMHAVLSGPLDRINDSALKKKKRLIEVLEENR